MRFDFHQAFSRSHRLAGVKGHLCALLLTVLLFALHFYFALFAIHLQDSGSVCLILGYLLLFAGLDWLLTGRLIRLHKVLGSIAAAGFVLVCVLQLWSAPLFQASAYHDQLQLTQTDQFSENFAEVDMSSVPVIDYDVARQLGDKKMGEVTALGSQFEISDDYTLCSVNGTLYRVSPLEYRDFIKWIQNRGEGVPGYIRVNVSDPSDVELVLLDEGMKFVESAFLNDRLERHVRLHYPTEMLTDYSFEVDDEGRPYYVVSTYRPKVGVYGGNDATGIILVDPISGACTKYDEDEVPQWVDRIQPSAFALEQLDNWGRYVNGFFNTLFGQRDMLTNTEGHNYISIDGEMYVYTGVTSIGADHSIVGFALINLKDKEATFYKVNGADEASAMSSAEGEVQEKGYEATFPILLNVGGHPTYFVSLKDQEGLVKQYAFVSLENYSLVGIGDTVGAAQRSYLLRLSENGKENESDPAAMQVVSGTLSALESAVQEGSTHYYFTIEGNDRLFIAPLSLSSELVMSEVGDAVQVRYVESEDMTIVIDAFDNETMHYDDPEE